LPLDYLDRFNDRIEAVTIEQIKDAFQRRIDVSRFVTVLAGPVEDAGDSVE
jgi:zinc protease